MKWNIFLNWSDLSKYKIINIFQRELQTKKPRVVVLSRNPKDCLVSFYHIHKLEFPRLEYTGDFKQFFEMYKTKDLVFGDYFDFYLSWWKYRWVEKNVVHLDKFEKWNEIICFLCPSCDQLFKTKDKSTWLYGIYLCANYFAKLSTNCSITWMLYDASWLIC